MIGIEPNLLYDLFLNYDKYAKELSLLTEPFWLNMIYIIAILFTFLFSVFFLFSFFASIINKSALALYGVFMCLPLIALPLNIHNMTKEYLYESALEQLKIHKNDWEVIQYYQEYHPDFKQKYLANFEKNKQIYEKIYQFHTPLKIDFNQKEENLKLTTQKDIFNVEQFEKRKINAQKHITNIKELLPQNNQEIEQKLNQCLDTQNINKKKFDYDNAGIWVCFNHQIVNILN